MFVWDVVLLRLVGESNPYELFVFLLHCLGYKNYQGFVVSLFCYYCILYVYWLICNDFSSILC